MVVNSFIGRKLRRLSFFLFSFFCTAQVLIHMLYKLHKCCSRNILHPLHYLHIINIVWQQQAITQTTHDSIASTSLDGLKKVHVQLHSIWGNHFKSYNLHVHVLFWIHCVTFTWLRFFLNYITSISSTKEKLSRSFQFWCHASINCTCLLVLDLQTI